ncbi:MAG TPA: hypothetical protein VK453_17795 [Micromonosporaceae bacterium]|nr:hypothetical protein [Micromonosporaceae bacterium]
MAKIVDEQEVVAWFAEGRTYRWMSEDYRRKYNIETSPSLWGTYRHLRGLHRPTTNDHGLVPWNVRERHRWAYPVIMLRAEARRRGGVDLSADDLAKLEAWLKRMKEDDTVLHYDPDTEEGWCYVPRRVGIDVDLIRVPDTTDKGAVD